METDPRESDRPASPQGGEGARRSPVREPCALLEDLFEGLLWTKLLRAPAMALRPQRLLLGAAVVIVLSLVGRIGLAWGAPQDLGSAALLVFGGPLADAAGAILNWQLPLLFVAFEELARAPGELLSTLPLSTLVIGPIMLVVWGVGIGTISRSVASEMALSRMPPWTGALGMSLGRWFSLFCALFIPIAAVGVIRFVLAAGGWALFNVPVLDLVGSVLYGFALFLSLIAVLVVVCYALGSWMLVPAVMCEGSDALDAVQRSFAYVAGRPLRLVIYLLVLIVQGAIVIWLIQQLAGAVVGFADAGVGYWATNEHGALSANPDGFANLAGTVLEFWRAVIAVLAAGFTVSYIASASTVLYLACRRLNDGQEIAEIWEPRAG